MKPTLSKSQYLKGLQCPKALWFYRHRKDLQPPIDSATQARFDAGNQIGQLAMQYFDEGVEVTDEYWAIEKAAHTTQDYIAQGNQVIFEATAIHPENGCYSRIDALRKVPNSDEWDLIEVKSSTSVRQYHIDDMSFQYYVFSAAGYKIRQCLMMVIDNSYMRMGAVDPKNLFRLEDISSKILPNQDEVMQGAKDLNQTLLGKNQPAIQIGAQCNKPFACDYQHHCWQHIPDYSVYNIYRGNKVDDIISKIASHDIKDIPANLLPNGLKKIDVEAYQNNQTHIDAENISAWLGKLSYPLYFLDYETIMPAIPLFDKTRPFQQIPFQFSLHIQRDEASDTENDTEHVEFLHQQLSDPRQAFAEALVKSCGTTGSVIAYNQSFEKARNRELARDFPQYANALHAINDRVIDLLQPFKKRWLYSPKQQSSASLKSVLPAFTDLSYDDMTIAGGGDAMNDYLDFMQGNIANPDELFKNLKQYCKLDTHAMLALMQKLYYVKQ